LHGQFAYSGLSDAVVVGRWYRDGELYEELETDPLTGWGTYTFFLREPPAGAYRLDLILSDTEELLQTAEFVVLDAAAYLEQAGELPEEAAYYRNLANPTCLTKIMATPPSRSRTRLTWTRSALPVTINGSGAARAVQQRRSRRQAAPGRRTAPYRV
jgi:hypothetical protein